VANTIDVRLSLEIVDSLKSLGKFQKAANKNLKRIQKQTTGLTGALRQAGATAAGFLAAKVVTQGLATFTNALTGAVQESIALENALIGLKSVASATNNDVGLITEAAKELAAEGLIPLTNISNSLKNLLAGGLSGDEAVRTFKSLRDAAAFNRQGQLELGEAIETATQGIKNNLSINVDNAGITKNLSILQREYAKRLDVSTASLSDQEKVLASSLGVQREALIFQGDFNRLLNTFSGAVSKSQTNLQFLNAELGNLITQNPVVIDLINQTAKAFESATEFVKKNQKAIIELINSAFSIAGRLVRVAGLVVAAFAAGAILKFFAAIFIGVKAATATFLGFGIQTRLFTRSFASGLKAAGTSFSAFSTVVRTGIKLIRGAVFLGLFLVIDEIIQRFIKARSEGRTFGAAISNVFQQVAVEGKIALLELSLFITKTFSSSSPIFKFLSTLPGVAGAAFKLFADSAVIGVDGITKSIVELKKELETLQGPNITPTGIGGAPGERSIAGGDPDAVPADPFVTIFDVAFRRLKEGFESVLKSFGQNARTIISGIGQGAAGVTQVVAQVATKALGPVAGQLVSIFAQGPEKVEELINSFFQALPQILVAITKGALQAVITLAENLDIFIEALIEAIPDIIDAIIVALPRIIQALVALIPRVITVLVKQAPKIIGALIKQIPKLVGVFIDELVKGALAFVDTIIKEIAGFLGIGGVEFDTEEFAKDVRQRGAPAVQEGAEDLAKDFGGFLGFQTGGIVPGSGNRDSIPALLTPGEFVVDRTDTKRLVDFLDKEESRLPDQAEERGSSRPLVINLQVGETQLAEVLLNLSEQGFRTA